MKISTVFKRIVVAGSVLMAVGAFSAPASTPAGQAAAGASPADRLAALQAERALLKVQVDIAKSQDELNKAKGEAATAAPTAPGGKGRSADTLPEPPQLISISGVGGVYSAIVESGGTTQSVKPGDRLASGWTVRAVSADGLTIAAGNRVMLLRP